MPIHVPRTVRCPTCHDLFEARLLTTLHASRKPGVREAVLGDAFGRVECASCGSAVRTEPVLLYTDFPRRQYFAHLPGEAFRFRDDLAARVHEGFHRNMVLAAAPMVREWAPEFRVRVVFGPERLREKLVCDDAGLDDRLVELGKIGLLRDVTPSAFTWDVGLTLRAVTDDGYVFALVTPVDGATEIYREIQVGPGWYDGVAARADALRAELPAFFETAIVDFRALFAPAAVALPPSAQAPGSIDGLYEILG